MSNFPNASQETDVYTGFLAVGAADKSNSATVANAANALTITPSATQYAYIAGFDLTGTGATAAKVVNVTVSDGTVTFNYTYLFVAGATVLNTPLSIRYPYPIRASAIATAWTVTVASSGAGGTNSGLTVLGFVL